MSGEPPIGSQLVREVKALQARVTELEAALRDIANGRWNSRSRVLDTKDNLTALQYARAALAADRTEEPPGSENEWTGSVTRRVILSERAETFDLADRTEEGEANEPA